MLADEVALDIKNINMVDMYAISARLLRLGLKYLAEPLTFYLINVLGHF